MYHFQTGIQWQQTVRKQRALSRARTRMIRAVGEARLPGWWIIVCAMGTMPAKIAMCPPVTWSDQSRMFARRSHSVWAWFLQRQNVKRVQLLSIVSVRSLSLMPGEVPRSCLNVNMEIIPGMLTLSPLYPPPTLSALSRPVPASPLRSLSGPWVWVSPSLSVAPWHSPSEHLQTLTHLYHDTQVRIIKTSSDIFRCCILK